MGTQAKIITSKAQQGGLAAYLRDVEKSQTLLLNEQSRQMQSEGKNVYKFGFGQSPFLPPQNVIDKLKETAHMKDYTPVQGIAELREAVAKFHSHYDKLDIQAKDVLIAPGSKILIFAVMLAFKKADVLIPAPSWVSYVPQAHLAGHDVIKIPLSFEQRWRLTPELLDKAALSKSDPNIPSILIFNYPGNPDGLTYTADELSALATVIKKHNIIVVSDEIYGMLEHNGNHKSIAHYCPDNAVITTGLSKWCGAGGWRLGVAIVPKALGGEFKETLLGVASETYSCAPTPIQMSAVVAYQPNDTISDYLKHQRRILSMLGNSCYQTLHKAGIDVHAPQGGFYLFPDFTRQLGKKFQTSQELCEKLLADTGVALLPGTAFGMPSSHLSARFAYVDFDGVKALEASQKIGLKQALDADFSNKYFAKMLEGTDKIGKWVASLR